ncbi:hypothetical protein, partial [Methanocalculus sp.]|uniref:hypothetical protein n=1 Tax=Methanocalculus sp. TaxID=2004547 RepID=UPI0025F492CB
MSVPVHLGHNMATTVTWCLALVGPLVNSVELTVFDRGFFSKDLMLTLTHAEVPYLIFAPKNEKIKKEIECLDIGEKKKIRYELEVNKDKTMFRGETTVAVLRQIFDKKSEKSYDWAFATNQES